MTARTLRGTARLGRTARLAGAAALVLVVAACGTAAEPTPPPATTSSQDTDRPTDPPTTAAALPEVPVRSADLASAAEPVGPAPTAVSIPALDVQLPVDPVGVQADGQMEIPPLAERAGWYRFGAAPSDAEGTTVVAAHVDSVASAGLGPFARLQELAPGDVVDVTLADGTVVPFAVTSVVAVAKSDAAWDAVFTREGPRRLVLITCGGTFQREERRYSDNIIVTADPVLG
ncbi:sortase [Actinotalea ferrariae]|uniref:class F sortase n=1 Tax=Actinotalea ferrariae TaxID=1386098 RepID=UPI001C8BBCA0|nr:class F sortase [Actinotalea ferrariae]MBX9243489.1 sortase [Actinotalea ferrariae]